jgi:hypothetical protein
MMSDKGNKLGRKAKMLAAKSTGRTKAKLMISEIKRDTAFKRAVGNSMKADIGETENAASFEYRPASKEVDRATIKWQKKQFWKEASKAESLGKTVKHLESLWDQPNSDSTRKKMDKKYPRKKEL